jgi:hypothetical protein
MYSIVGILFTNARDSMTHISLGTDIHGLYLQWIQVGCRARNAWYAVSIQQIIAGVLIHSAKLTKIKKVDNYMKNIYKQ